MKVWVEVRGLGNPVNKYVVGDEIKVGFGAGGMAGFAADVAADDVEGVCCGEAVDELCVGWDGG